MWCLYHCSHPKLKIHSKQAIFNESRELDLFCEYYKEIIEALAEAKITEENKGEIELNVSVKIVIFERKVVKIAKEMENNNPKRETIREYPLFAP